MSPSSAARPPRFRFTYTHATSFCRRRQACRPLLRFTAPSPTQTLLPRPLSPSPSLKFSQSISPNPATNGSPLSHCSSLAAKLVALSSIASPPSPRRPSSLVHSLHLLHCNFPNQFTQTLPPTAHLYLYSLFSCRRAYRLLIRRAPACVDPVPSSPFFAVHIFHHFNCNFPNQFLQTLPPTTHPSLSSLVSRCRESCLSLIRHIPRAYPPLPSPSSVVPFLHLFLAISQINFPKPCHQRLTPFPHDLCCLFSNPTNPNLLPSPDTPPIFTPPLDHGSTRRDMRVEF